MKNFPPFKRVMLIDDNCMCRILAARVLKQYHFANEFLSYENGGKALRYLNENQCLLPEIIFLDLNMPHIDGFEFLKRFAMLSKTIHEHCSIVMLTSSTDTEDIKRVKEDEYVRLFLSKPLAQLKLKCIAGRFSKLLHNN